MLDVLLETTFLKPIKSGAVKSNFELGHKMEPIIAARDLKTIVGQNTVEKIDHAKGLLKVSILTW